jgi:DNA-binding IscR family transcriptional regulator
MLARERNRITARDILRATTAVDDESEKAASRSPLLGQVVARAENAFSDALSHISVESLARSTAALRKEQRRRRRFGHARTHPV